MTESEESEEEIERPVNFVSLRKVSKPEIVTKKEKSATPEPEFLRPALKKVEKKPEVDTQARRPSSPEITTSKFVKPALRKVRRDPSKKEFPKEKLLETVELKKTPKQERELRREPTIPSIQEIKQENVKKSKLKLSQRDFFGNAAYCAALKIAFFDMAESWEKQLFL